MRKHMSKLVSKKRPVAAAFACCFFLLSSSAFSQTSSARLKVEKLLSEASTDLEKRHLKPAQEKSRQALGLLPQYPPALAFHARLLLISEDDDKAYAELERAIALDANLLKDSEVLRCRIDCLLAQGKNEDALKNATALIKVAPNDIVRGIAYRSRGQINSVMGRNEDALKDLSDSIKCSPHQYWTFIDRAMVYTALKRYDQAVADYSEVIRQKPATTVAYSRRAEVYAKLGKSALAAKDRAAALRLGRED